MNRGFLCGVLFVVVSVTTRSQGKRIAFLATPKTISPGVTPELTVRCTIWDDGKSGVSRVNNIFIRAVNGSVEKEIARVTYGQAQKLGFWTEGVIVTGEASNKVGFLQVTWPSPRQGQTGQYNCDISAQSNAGKTIDYKSSIQVVSTGNNDDSSNSNQCPCTEDIEALKKAVGDSQREFDSLKKTVNDLKTNIDGLSSVHNEEGVVSCRDSDTWGEKMKERETVVEVRFSNPYARNPLVVISPVVLDVDKLWNLRYRVDIRDLTATGFKIVCGTWWDTTLYRIDVRWTSSVA